MAARARIKPRYGILLGIALLLSAATAAAYHILQRETAPDIHERASQLKSDAAAPGAPAWAGQYADEGGNHGADDVLTLSASGYCHRGNYMSDEGVCGSVKALGDGVLVLRPEGWGRAKTLRLIPWDERVYAVFDDQKMSFLNSVNSHLGPEGRGYIRQMRYKAPSDRRGRMGRARRAAAGPPRVPDDWRPFLLDRPVEARITKVGPIRYVRASGSRVIAVELDAGRSRGLVPGMRLELKNFGTSTDIVLTNVSESASSGEAEQSGDYYPLESQRLPWVGEKAVSYAVFGDTWEQR